jgi:hypothetical protein
MRAPRESFLLTGKAPEFKKLVANDAFEPACSHALLQLQSEMVPNRLPGLPIDPCAGLDANAQMQGAARVLEILRTIADPVTQPTPVKRERLHTEM